MIDLGKTCALLGRACTYTLQSFRVFVPPNSPGIEGKIKIFLKAPGIRRAIRQGGSKNEEIICLDVHAALHIRFGRM